jgi:hypothetical protein
MLLVPLCLLLAQSLADGLARMQSNDFAEAAKILESVTAREPENGRAWRNLALAYERLHEPDRAIDAYQHSLTAQPAFAGPQFQIARLYAGKGDSDHAIEWLGKAKATRKIDLTQVESAQEFAALRNDARLKALMPKATDFENPFVEPVKIVREWRGEASNDQFGWIARRVSADSFVTSAPTKAIEGANAGRVYVYSLGTGKLLWSTDGKPGDQLGIGIEGTGDGNVIASAPGAGKAYLYSGKDGRMLQTFTAEDVHDNFGRHVDGVGVSDVFIGAPGNHGGTGAAYVYSAKGGKLLLKLSGEREGDNFGSAVAAYKSKDRTMLIVGAPRGGLRRTGKIYVYDDLSGKPKFTFEADEGAGQALGGMFVSVTGGGDVFASDWPDNRVYVYSGKDGHKLFTLTGSTPGEGLGTSSSIAGADLMIGAWQYAGEAQSGGRAYLYSGDGKLKQTITCRIPGDTFGFDAIGLGEGRYLITSAWSGVHGFHSGRVFVVGLK